MRRYRMVACIAVAALAAISAATWPRTAERAAAPLLVGAQVTPEVRGLIERACQDCHSERTRYPWYSYVAPISWFVWQDVAAGRERLNFSRWAEYSVARRERALSEIANQVQERKMPLQQYTLIHRDARLSDAEIAAIFRWTQAERARLIAETAGR